jgi:hypothetical protein
VTAVQMTRGCKAHLYRAEFSLGIDVATFIPGGGSAQYKCVGLTFVPSGATNRYKCETFVPRGLNQAPASLYERTFVPVGGFNRFVLMGKISSTNEKSDLGYMCDSLVVPPCGLQQTRRPRLTAVTERANYRESLWLPRAQSRGSRQN